MEPSAPHRSRTSLPAPRTIAVIAVGVIVGGVLLGLGVGVIVGPGPSQPVAIGPSLEPGGSSFPSTSAGSSAGTVPVPSGTPSTRTQTPSRPPATRPAPAGAKLPVKGSGVETGTAIEMTPGPDGSLYVSLPGPGGEVVTRLDRSGEAAHGWPILLAGVDGCDQVLPVDDGASVRVLCVRTRQTGTDTVSVRRSFALDSAGRTLPGWPVDIDNGTIGRVVGDDLVVLVNPLSSVGGEAGQSWPVSLSTIGADGTVETGVDVPFVCCDLAWAIGSDALAFGTTHRDWSNAASVKTDVTAFGAGGVAPGWPITIDGNASEVAFDKNLGLAYVVVGSPTDPPARTVVLDDDGSLPGSGSTTQPIISTSTWNGAGADSPGPPIVAADGSTYIVGTTGHRTTVMALDPGGKVRAGWPYRVELGLQWTGICGAGDTGCGQHRTVPQVSDSNVLYLPMVGASPSAGGSVIAVGTNGKVRPGWPVRLRRAGSMFWSITVDPRGGVWALAIEPERSSSSATILSIADDSTVRYATTIVQP